jgi:DNA-binding NarL/FixJ family response regulator
VEKHRARLMNKLDLRTTAALTAFALEQGLTAG